MIRSFALALVWIAFIGAWLWLQASEVKHGDVVARIDLLVNHQIDTGEVTVAGVTGRYVMDEIKANNAIVPRALASAPKIDKGQVLASVSISRQLLPQVAKQEKQPVHICDGSKPLGDAIVQFIACDRSESSDCVALLSAISKDKKLPELAPNARVGVDACQ